MTAQFPRLVAFLLLISAAFAAAPGSQAEPQAQKISQFSGKAVPRFESLRYSAVHGRQGPTLDHPILWRYEREGLPMLIIRETHGWRRVRDKDGDEVWMQARMLTANRHVLITSDQIMRRKPDEQSAGRAALKTGALAELIACEGAWCEVKVARKTGWVQRAGLWGVETATDGL